MTKVLTIAAAVWLLGAPSSAQSPASTPPAPTGIVVGSGNFFSPIVADLDRAQAFYRDGLGLDVTGPPGNADTNPALRNMFGLPDAQLRWTIGHPPGMRNGVEMVEIGKAGGKKVERRIQDTGAFTFIVLVRDLDATIARVKRAGAPIVSANGNPVRFPFGTGKSRGIVVKDPDGHFVELFQFDPLPETAAPASANVIGVRIRLTVDDAAQAMRLYHDGLGLQQVGLDEFKSDPNVSAMFGIPGGEFRLGTALVPGTGLTVEFIEYRGVDHQRVMSDLRDPGSTRLQLQVRDVDEAIRALTNAGGAVISTGGGPVELPRTGGPPIKVAIVRDPNNLFVVLLQAARP